MVTQQIRSIPADLAYSRLLRSTRRGVARARAETVHQHRTQWVANQDNPGDSPDTSNEEALEELLPVVVRAKTKKVVSLARATTVPAAARTGVTTGSRG